MNPLKNILSILILLIGLALLVRSVMIMGFAYSTGMVAGTAFVIYGAARIYFTRGT